MSDNAQYEEFFRLLHEAYQLLVKQKAKADASIEDTNNIKATKK